MEMDFDALLEISGKVFKVSPLPKFPSIVRDISIIVDEALIWQDIISLITKNAPSILETIDFVDMYRGKQIPNGKKSITITMTFRDEDGTLTHDCVDTYEKPIIAALEQTFGAQLRSA